MAITTIEMLFVQTVAFTGLFHSIQGFQLPSLPLPSYGNQVVSGQLDSLDHLKCGLTYNIWGQVSPTLASGHANLCLQCRISTPGSTFNFAYVEALSASISAHGVSTSDAQILQTSINQPDQKLAKLVNRLALGTNVAHPRLLRGASPEEAQDIAVFVVRLPFHQMLEHGALLLTGNSCPISLTASFTPSTGFECLDIKQEITSCGGCATLNKGVDCSTIDGAALTGCSDGVCKIVSQSPTLAISSYTRAKHGTYKKIPPVSCKQGYAYSQSGKECLKISHFNSLK
ncbi:hypothetical protein KEM48_007833 [Puccinia striiformis f. sp. tritici PST-130]|nr:hypothetical protein KEM48_007833 [Puccinia striiformis f. sp. tritici PST-130]